jgi:hypothetical protein
MCGTGSRFSWLLRYNLDNNTSKKPHIILLNTQWHMTAHYSSIYDNTVSGSLDKKEGRRRHLLLSKRWHLLPLFCLTNPAQLTIRMQACTRSKDVSSIFILSFNKFAVKETVSRDFWPLVFFHKSTAPRPLINTLKFFEFCFEFAELFDFKGSKNSTTRYAT